MYNVIGYSIYFSEYEGRQIVYTRGVTSIAEEAISSIFRALSINQLPAWIVERVH